MINGLSKRRRLSLDCIFGDISMIGDGIKLQMHGCTPHPMAYRDQVRSTLHKARARRPFFDERAASRNVRHGVKWLVQYLFEESLLSTFHDGFDAACRDIRESFSTFDLSSLTEKINLSLRTNAPISPLP